MGIIFLCHCTCDRRWWRNKVCQ